MKAKVSLKRAKFQQFLLTHVEKLLVGGVFLGFCFLVYRALNVEPYPKTPDDLASVTGKANDQIERPISQADLQHAVNADGSLEVQNYEEIADDRTFIDPRAVTRGFVHLSRGDSTSGRRPKPDFLPVEGLRADASNGMFALLLTDAERAARQAELMQAAAAERGAGDEGGDNEGRRTRRGALSEDGRSFARRGGGRDSTGRPYGDSGYDDLTDFDGGRSQFFGPGQQPEENLPEPPLVTVSPDMAKAQGMRWVVLTGLVPVRKQAAEFRAQFEETGNYFPDTDYPFYVHFDVQRAEVVPGQAADQRNWQPVDVLQNTVRMEMQFAADFPLDCDQMYLDQVLTRPLPPLLARNWGDSAVHKPEIEMLKMTVGRYGFVRGEDELDAGQNVLLQAAPGDEQPGGNLLLNQGGGLDGGRSSYRGSDSDDEGSGRTNRRMPVRANRSNRGRNPYANMPSRHGRGPNIINRGEDDEGGGGAYLMGVQMADYTLFRFFDYSVQPSKSYVYRVRLKLMNPNYDLPSHMLKNSELAKAEYVDTPWTELDGAVKVPGDSYLLAGAVQPPRGANEPSVKVFVESFDIQQGLKASELFTLRRGDIAGDRQRSVKLSDPITLEIKDQKLDFDTDTVLLDMIGGESLGEKNRDDAPGMLLLLDEAGNLIVRGELDDKQQYDEAQAELDRIKNATKPASLPEDSGLGPDGRPTGRRNRGNTSEDDS